ncbi:MAG TPA: helix-turn-helix domain-containing protein [Ruminiclostridium sp.]|nr:helix-turn-helix domain-containing protein [Ruminiclostridium sp.]
MLEEKVSKDEESEECPSGVECSIEKALEVLGGKWTFLILRDLFDGKKRFGEIRKSLIGVSPKTLSTRLKELEERGIVIRCAYPTIPPTVEYSLTEKGQSLKKIIKEMKLWGARWG